MVLINYDQIAHQYANNRKLHPEVLKDLLAKGNVTQTSQVLEVGCGTGNYLSAIQASMGCPCWGLDPWPGMLAKTTGNGNLRLHLARAEALALAGHQFDLVYSVDVIHHVQDRPSYYREAFRLLRPGGRLCTVTDSAWIIEQRQPLSIYFPDTVPLELQRYPDIAELREMMRQAGFVEISEQIVETCYKLTDLQPYRDKAFSALHLISEEAFQRGLAQMEGDLQHGPIWSVPRYLMMWGFS